MAHKTPLASWLYSNRNLLGTVFNEFHWPRQYLPEVFDFSTKIFLNGIEAEGRGLDLNREIAIEKSASEAVERLICQNLEFDSVGFAVTGSFDPSAHARFECLERYFLNHHLEHQINFEVLKEANFLATQFSKSNPGAYVSFYKMAAPKELCGVVCLIEKTFEQVKAIGFALSDSLETSLTRSLFEALPNYAWLVDRSNKRIKDEESIPWHVDKNFVGKIIPLLKGDKNLNKRSNVIDLPPVERVTVDYSKLSALNDAPIRLARFQVIS